MIESTSLDYSPYNMGDSCILLTVKQPKGISSKRLAYLYKTGQLTIHSETIIHMLHEFSLLTGYLIYLGFQVPFMESSLKKICLSGRKNPYHSELSFLRKTGIVDVFQIYDIRTNKKRFYIYYLTAGARQWAEERFEQNPLYTTRPTDVCLFNNSVLNGAQVFEMLSLIQLQIGVVAAHRSQLNAFETIYNFSGSEKLCYTKYLTIKAQLIIAFSCHGESLHLDSDLMMANIIQTHKKNHILYAVIMVVDTLLSAERIHCHLKSINWPYLPYLCYIRDKSSMNRQNPFKGQIIRFDEQNSYSICSLNL